MEDRRRYHRIGNDVSTCTNWYSRNDKPMIKPGFYGSFPLIRTRTPPYYLTVRRTAWSPAGHTLHRPTGLGMTWCPSTCYRCRCQRMRRLLFSKYHHSSSSSCHPRYPCHLRRPRRCRRCRRWCWCHYWRHYSCQGWRRLRCFHRRSDRRR